MKELVQKNKILVMETGSSVYGARVATSDTDYMGVFVAPKRFYLGLDKVEEVDLSTVSKLESGKNAPDAIDYKFYELRKFVKLALENNPNILSSLFTPYDKVKEYNELGKILFDHNVLFPHQGLKQKYLGYAFSQKHKMEIKVDNYSTLMEFDKWLDENLRNPREEVLVNDNDYFSNQLLAELRENKTLKGIVKFNEHHATVGDINITLTDKLSKVTAKVKDRLSKVGNREELYTKYGYDTKFGMHLVRLMLEGIELLETGKLEYPLKDRAMLLDIRNGKWKKEEILQYAVELEKQLETMKTDLPAKPRFDMVESLLMEMVETHWNKQ